MALTPSNPPVLSVDQSSVNANNDCTFTPGSSNATWTCSYTLRDAQNASSDLNWTPTSSGFFNANMTTSFSPPSGTIPPGASQSVTLTVTTGGFYSCQQSFSATVTFQGPNTVNVPWKCTDPYYTASPSSINGDTNCQHSPGNLWICTVTLTQQSQGITNVSGESTGSGGYATFNFNPSETDGPGETITVTVTVNVNNSCPVNITLIFLSTPNVSVPWSCTAGTGIITHSVNSRLMLIQDRWIRRT